MFRAGPGRAAFSTRDSDGGAAPRGSRCSAHPSALPAPRGRPGQGNESGRSSEGKSGAASAGARARHTRVRAHGWPSPGCAEAHRELSVLP